MGQGSVDKRTEVFYTGEEKGWGVRASKEIGKDQLVAEYIGDVVRRTDITTWRYAMELKKGVVIDASQAGGPGRFLNHSCSPNCYAQRWIVAGEWRVGIFASRLLKQNEELTFSYAGCERSSFGDRESPDPCRCGEPDCRGIICAAPSGGRKTAKKLVARGADQPVTSISPNPKRKRGRPRKAPTADNLLANACQVPYKKQAIGALLRRKRRQSEVATTGPAGALLARRTAVLGANGQLLPQARWLSALMFGRDRISENVHGARQREQSHIAPLMQTSQRLAIEPLLANIWPGNTERRLARKYALYDATKLAYARCRWAKKRERIGVRDASEHARCELLHTQRSDSRDDLRSQRYATEAPQLDGNKDVKIVGDARMATEQLRKSDQESMDQVSQASTHEQQNQQPQQSQQTQQPRTSSGPKMIQELVQQCALSDGNAYWPSVHALVIENLLSSALTQGMQCESHSCLVTGDLCGAADGNEPSGCSNRTLDQDPIPSTSEKENRADLLGRVLHTFEKALLTTK